MIVYHKNKINSKTTVQGRGLVNKFINSLPFELHIPGYQFCGPGTKLDKRLERGDQGINPLDRACKTHDISYSQNKDISERNKADKELAERAWERVKAKDSSLGERIYAYLVTNAMKTKVKFGLGLEKKPKKKCGKNIFNFAVKNATAILKKQKPRDINSAIKIARRVIQKSFKGKKTQVIIPRVIRVPKIGGFLPLIPILSALGALGALTSGASSIARAVTKTKNAKQQLEENFRHNKSMEAIAMGRGLYLKPYKKGMGILYNNKNQTKN